MKPHADKHLFRSHSENYARKFWGNLKVGLILMLILWLLALLTGYAQSAPVTADEMRNERVSQTRLEQGYQTSVSGWVIHQEDTLHIGKASLPNRQFAFVYQNPGSLNASYANGHLVQRYMTSDYAGKRAILKEFAQNGTKKQGFTMCAIIGVGMPIRYYVELENAIEAGELLPPPAYRSSGQSAASASSSVADELIKLKGLLDAGAITPAEYDNQKKKLLKN